jgi:hypothetical protein
MGSVAHENWRFQHETGELRVSGVGDPKIVTTWSHFEAEAHGLGCPISQKD